MSTTIRPELSRKNKYWIERHRYYELKHFCMQYDIWKQASDSITSLVQPRLNRGKDRGVVIRYGKNLTDIEQEENCSSVYTGVYNRLADGGANRRYRLKSGGGKRYGETCGKPN